jgi:hypothetical protein
LQILCKKQEKRKQALLQDAAKNVKFMIGPEEIVRNKTFKYLGRIINDSDEDLTAVENQLKQTRQVWARISRIIKEKTNCSIKIMSTFYKSSVQTILLYGSASWVLTQFIMDKLNTFHNMCARYISGRHIRLENETWIYPKHRDNITASKLTYNRYIHRKKKKGKLCSHTTNI